MSSSSFDSHTYRNGFVDISVPMFNPKTANLAILPLSLNKKKFQIITTQVKLNDSIRSMLERMGPSIVILETVRNQIV